jgi:hypothetical protein
MLGGPTANYGSRTQDFKEPKGSGLRALPVEAALARGHCKGTP